MNFSYCLIRKINQLHGDVIDGDYISNLILHLRLYKGYMAGVGTIYLKTYDYQNNSQSMHFNFLRPKQ